MSILESRPEPPLFFADHAIHFEPGFHPLGKQNIDAVAQDVKLGHLDAHLWQPDVAKRLVTYAFTAPALFLAVDGESVLKDILGTASGQETVTEKKVGEWMRLPARPSKLHKSGTVTLIKGDFDGDLFYDDTAYIVSQGISLVSENTLIALSILAATKTFFHHEPQVQPDEGLSRRSLLKASLALAAGIAIGSGIRKLPSIFATTARTEEVKDFWHTINDLIGPQTFSDTWVKGRTAALIAKTQDVTQSVNIPGAQFAVVMGSEHDQNSDTYLDNKEARKKMIHQWAILFLDTAKRVLSQYHKIPVDQISDQVINALLDRFREMETVEITDPGGDDFQPDTMARIVGTDEYINSRHTLRSMQVEEAIHDLRPHLG